MTRELMTGNTAAVEAIIRCRPKVISAFPITPQTTIIEKLADAVGDGKLDAKYLTMEGEHGAMAAAASAAATGIRVFTATSSHGLAYMNEMLWWVAGARLPMVMINVNRTIGAPWSIGSEQTDSLSTRDIGWIQIYCATAQEVLDTVIQGYKLAEQINIPVMICYDGFFISHTVEVVDLPGQDEVDAFLPPLKLEHKLDPENPKAFYISVMASNNIFTKMRKDTHDAMVGSVNLLAEVDKDFGEKFGRSYGLVETYRNDDAEIALLTVSSMDGTARIAVDRMREQGLKIGVVRQRLFRPMPVDVLREALAIKEKVIVLNRNISMGAGGFFTQELKSIFYDLPCKPTITDVVLGLGGEDVQPDTIEQVVRQALEKDRGEKTIWITA